ncbi:hypothetical protein G7046_g8640 [Stylonectria norvegica]|nr:hypothetical protein G7046_g8640 [Stylonectria norvegica]
MEKKKDVDKNVKKEEDELSSSMGTYQGEEMVFQMDDYEGDVPMSTDAVNTSGMVNYYRELSRNPPDYLYDDGHNSVRQAVTNQASASGSVREARAPDRNTDMPRVQTPANYHEPGSPPRRPRFCLPPREPSPTRPRIFMPFRPATPPSIPAYVPPELRTGTQPIDIPPRRPPRPQISVEELNRREQECIARLRQTNRERAAAAEAAAPVFYPEIEEPPSPKVPFKLTPTKPFHHPNRG